jgi:AraC-like DNA-binding protein
MAQPLASDFQTHGLFAHRWKERRNPLPGFHRHNEIELGLMPRGRMVATIAGQSVVIPRRALCVFWGGFSHRVLVWEKAENWSLSIPLTVFLSWPLPHESFVHPILHGQLLHDTDPLGWEHDLALMQRWYADLHGDSPAERQQVLLLEVQARLRRLALRAGTGAVLAQHGVEPDRVAHMLQFIAEHYTQERLSVAQVAEAARTNPSYAMGLFKESCGASIMQYVNDQRVAHARRMLALTDEKILNVAADAGFGSPSQFYNVFQRVTGQTPGQYAREHRPLTRSRGKEEP